MNFEEEIGHKWSHLVDGFFWRGICQDFWGSVRSLGIIQDLFFEGFFTKYLLFSAPSNG